MREKQNLMDEIEIDVWTKSAKMTEYWVFGRGNVLEKGRNEDGDAPEGEGRGIRWRIRFWASDDNTNLSVWGFVKKGRNMVDKIDSEI